MHQQVNNTMTENCFLNSEYIVPFNEILQSKLHVSLVYYSAYLVLFSGSHFVGRRQSFIAISVPVTLWRDDAGGISDDSDLAVDMHDADMKENLHIYRTGTRPFLSIYLLRISHRA